MKKTAVLAAALALCATQAWAYDNTSGGYSVQDNTPFLSMATDKIYAYSSITAKNFTGSKMEDNFMHMVNYYTKYDMENGLGEQYSDAYFAKEFNKLAVLNRSELSMETVPTPLLDFEKYAKDIYNSKFLSNEIYKNFKANVRPQITLHVLNNGVLQPVNDKTNLANLKGTPVIKLSYAFKRDAKGRSNANTTLADILLLSAHDRLYMLYSSASIPEAEKKDAGTPTKAKSHDTDELLIKDQNADKNGNLNVESPAEDDSLLNVSLEDALKDAIEFKPADVKAINQQAVKKYQQSVAAFYKGFKTSAPAAPATKLTYTDNVTNKKMDLPLDWYYAQLQIADKDALANFTMSGSMTTLLQISEEIDYDTMGGKKVSKPSKAETKAEKDAREADERKANFIAETKKALAKFDVLLVTGSFKTSDAKYVETLSTPHKNKLMAEEMIQSTLEDLKKMNNEYIALTDYSYKLLFDMDKVKLDILTDVNFFQDVPFKNFVSLNWNDNSGTGILCTHQNEYELDETIQKQLQEWEL